MVSMLVLLTHTHLTSFFFFLHFMIKKTYCIFKISSPSIMFEQIRFGLSPSLTWAKMLSFFALIKPLVAVYQTLPQTVFFFNRQMNMAEFIFSDCLGCTLLLAALCQRDPTDTDYRSQLKKCCLQALRGKQQGTPCCTPPCCFLLYYKCSVLWDKMKGVRL